MMPTKQLSKSWIVAQWATLIAPLLCSVNIFLKYFKIFL